MKQRLWVLVTLSALSLAALAKEPPKKQLSLQFFPIPATSSVLQSADCSEDCYTNDTVCAKVAKLYQLAEATDGKTYELKCESSALEGGDCPLPLGTYQGYRDGQKIYVSHADNASPRHTFSILSERKTVQRGSASTAGTANCTSR